MMCRLVLKREGVSYDYEAAEGDTYEDALLAYDIIPDTVLIYYQGKSLPQDKPVEEPEVEIITTCSRG